MNEPELPVFRGRVVPWITPWSGAPNLPEPLVLAPLGRGIAYADEGVHDRTYDGVLLARGRGRRATDAAGVPLYDQVDPRRQHKAADRLLCQVCGSKPPPHPEGLLWLLAGAEGSVEESLTLTPPLCPDPCARLALRQCPALARSHAAVRVGFPRPWGYHGDQYAPGPDGLPATTATAVHLPHEDPRLPWLLADLAVTQLMGCTPAYDVGNAS
ncbi:hypothetical protein ABZ714_06655 [Streptomyces sp. NPDC006798]|uniref:hypothetical protein n=1 Tax=Streptomyces sp. NPDC006798 TaxID=3155462 RepID=UPI003409B446